MKKSILIILLCLGVKAEIVDLKQYQSSVKDQKDRNTCAYFATTALMETTVKEHFGTEYDLSEQFQIHHGKTHYNEYADKEFGSTYEIALNFKYQGYSYLESAVEYGLSWFEPGQPCESEDPYDTSTRADCFSQDPLVYQSKKRVSYAGLEVEWISGMFTYWQSRSENIMDRIRKKQSVVITLKVYPPTWDQAQVSYDSEIDAKCESGEYSCYGHAVVLTGFDSQRKVFFFKNSWGSSWGNEGYGEVPFDYVDNFSDMPITMNFSRYAYLKERE